MARTQMAKGPMYRPTQVTQALDMTPGASWDIRLNPRSGVRHHRKIVGEYPEKRNGDWELCGFDGVWTYCMYMFTRRQSAVGSV